MLAACVAYAKQCLGPPAAFQTAVLHAFFSPSFIIFLNRFFCVCGLSFLIVSRRRTEGCTDLHDNGLPVKKKKKNEREAIKCSSVIRSLDIVRQVMMVVLFTLRQRHRHRQRLLQHTCRLLTVLFFLHRLLHRPPLLRGISSIFWPDSVPHKSSLGERLLIQVPPHGYPHSKGSHTSVQDLVVHVRVR